MLRREHIALNGDPVECTGRSAPCQPGLPTLHRVAGRVRCLAWPAGQAVAQHSLAMFEVAGIHRTSITPGGVAIGGLYSTCEIATAIAARTKTSSAVCQRLRLSHTAYSVTGTPPDQAAPGETTRDRVAVESVPPAADRPEPDGFSGVPVPNMSEAGSPLFALALAKFWGLLTRTCGCVPCSSVTAAWKSVCALSMEPILFDHPQCGSTSTTQFEFTCTGSIVTMTFLGQCRARPFVADVRSELTRPGSHNDGAGRGLSKEQAVNNRGETC
jgi:hypothetical protein